MAVDERLWGSESGKSESETGKTFPLIPYYNDDLFPHLCTAGPNGMAVYFDLNIGRKDCASIEENKSSDEAEICLPPQNFVPSASKKDWLISMVISSLQYTVFGMFVLCFNKLRRFHKRRKRLSSSTTSLDDASLEVSYSWYNIIPVCGTEVYRLVEGEQQS